MTLRVGAIAIALFCFGEDARAQAGIAKLEALLSRLNADVVTSANTFNAAFGLRLAEDEGSSSFVRSHAQDIMLDGLRFREIELRAPRPGEEVTAGPILVLALDTEAETCISMDDVRQAYPDLHWFGPPSPHAMDADETLERQQGAARQLFGFAATGTNCLRTIVYRFDEPL